MIEALFVILLTFVSATHSETKALKCEDQRCVDIIIYNAGHESTTVRRLRVFKAAEYGGTLPLHNTPFPALLDITYD